MTVLVHPHVGMGAPLLDLKAGCWTLDASSKIADDLRSNSAANNAQESEDVLHSVCSRSGRDRPRLAVD